MIDERTRVEAQRLCAHVISRKRHGRTGPIGLAWTGTGLGTDALELRADGLHRAADGATLPVTDLAAAPAFAGVDLDAPFSVGHETPELGDPNAELALEPVALQALLAFYELGWRVLSEVADGATITVWPEHFDAAFTWREQANVGASPGDATSAEPYVYVGPWGSERPGGEALWNVPFGALIPATAPEADLVAFVRDRLAALERATPAPSCSANRRWRPTSEVGSRAQRRGEDAGWRGAGLGVPRLRTAVRAVAAAPRVRAGNDPRGVLLDRTGLSLPVTSPTDGSAAVSPAGRERVGHDRRGRTPPSGHVVATPRPPRRLRRR